MVPDAHNAGIVIVDADGTILFWNATAERYFGYRASEVLGRRVDLLVPDEFRQQHREGLERAMSGGERHLEGAATHLPVRHADGFIRVHAARFHHICEPGGGLIAALAVFGDEAHVEPWTPITAS